MAQRTGAPLDRAEIAAFYTRGEKPVGVLRGLRALDQYLITRPDDLELLAGKGREVSVGMYILAVPLAYYFWTVVSKH
jgi:hypothetical protein